jgi:DNA-binding transcriptional ArsR family regulator
MMLPMASQPGRPRKAAGTGTPSGAAGAASASAACGAAGVGGVAGVAPGAADQFAALADPTRRHLLERLAASDHTVSELMTGLDISQAAVSQHLRVLREASLVTARRAGRHRLYRMRPAALTELRDWLDELDRFWRERLAALGDYLEEQPG